MTTEKALEMVEQLRDHDVAEFCANPRAYLDDPDLFERIELWNYLFWILVETRAKEAGLNENH